MSETITVIGNVASVPEERTTGRGSRLTSFRLAATPRRFDAESQTWADGATNWYTVSVWRGLGANALESLHRGERVIVVGRLRIRAWENGDRRGIAVDIDAEAVGHDLKWGTSTFAARSGGSGAEATGGGDDEWDPRASPEPGELAETPF